MLSYFEWASLMAAIYISPVMPKPLGALCALMFTALAFHVKGVS